MEISGLDRSGAGLSEDRVQHDPAAESSAAGKPGWRRSGRLAAGGKSLEYRCSGPAPDEAPSIVLLHEGLGSAGLWRDFPKALSMATGLGVCAYSRAGYGLSDPVELPTSLDGLTREAVEVLPEVLDAIGFRRGFLFGHSDGATIAALHAGLVGDRRVLGVVLLAPHFFTEEVGMAEIRRTSEAFASGDLRRRMAKYHRDPENAFRGWSERWLDPASRDWNVTKVLGSVRVPVLAIQGLDDQYGTLDQIESIEALCPAPVTKLILEDCRHAPFHDRPEAVMELVAAFCARHAGIIAAETGVG